MKQYSEAARLLEENRAAVLAALLNTEGNILENKAAIESLMECQANINEHIMKINKVKGHQEKILEVNIGYHPIAKHATVLFETIKKLSNLNPMYRYSLQWFSNLYAYSIESSNKSKMLQKRLRYLSDHLTYNSFLQISRSVYEKDRRTFSFMLCIDLMIYKENLQTEDFETLLEDGSEEMTETNPAADWLSNTTWNYLCSLDRLPAYQGIAEGNIQA